MSTNAESPAPRRRRWWHRLLDWFRGAQPAPPPPPPPPPPEETEVVYRAQAPEAPVTALCQGDVFEFQVYADLVWSADAIAYERLIAKADEYAASALDTLRERVWRTARQFPPNQAAAAEEAIQAELDRSWCYTSGTTVIRCAGRVRVLPDPRVREHLLEAGYRELDTDAYAVLGRLRADRLEELTIRWREVLTALGHEPATTHAAQLADSQFAGIVAQLAENRRESAVELIGILRRATRDHEYLGLYEFANTYDTALQAFRRQMGLEADGAAEGMP